MRIVILGYVVRYPLGGLAWHYIQYAMGMARLGHEVAYIEDSGDETWCCYDPSRYLSDADPTYGLAFADRLFPCVGLADDWGYFDKHTNSWHGPMADRAESFCRTADLMINISGANVIRPWTAEAPRRLYVDTDPVFTQVHNLTEPDRMDFALQHNAFVTFAENWGSQATVPDDGLPWRPTRQPIVMDAWDLGPPPAHGPYTTVMQWTSYEPVEYAGRQYGLKSQTFKDFEDLPSLVGVDLELALGSRNAPREEIASHGWRLADPLEVTRDAWTYQSYISASRAEFSIAKHGYVTTNSGWFSERSANYMAAGRPVIAQDTGFDTWLPTGEGLFSFRTQEEAAAAIDEVEGNYQRHAQMARRLALDYFDSDMVLRSLLSGLGY